jgi:hypothetical protein
VPSAYWLKVAPIRIDPRRSTKAETSSNPLDGDTRAPYGRPGRSVDGRPTQ